MSELTLTTVVRDKIVIGSYVPIAEVWHSLTNHRLDPQKHHNDRLGVGRRYNAGPHASSIRGHQFGEKLALEFSAYVFMKGRVLVQYRHSCYVSIQQRNPSD